MLIGAWVVFVFYKAFIIENVFSIVTESFPMTSLSRIPNEELLKGYKIMGSFSAGYDHLGIIGFRFWNFYRISEDKIIFRIRPADEEEWHYENIYGVDQFQPHQYFTFGFPIIDNTKGRNFVFEIESTAGIPGDAIGVSDQNPIFIAKYQYPKSMIISSPEEMIRFGILKVHNLLKNSEFTSSVYIYLLPATLYMLYILGPGKTVTKSLGWQFRYVIAFVRNFLYRNKLRFSHLLLLSGIGVDIYFVKSGDLTLTILMSITAGLWLIYRRDFDEVFYLAAIALAATILAYTLGDYSIAERGGSWVWAFLAIWIGYRLWWLQKPGKPGRTVENHTQPGTEGLRARLIGAASGNEVISKILLAAGRLALGNHKYEFLRWKLDRGDDNFRLDYPLDETSLVFDLGGYQGEWTEAIYKRYRPRIMVFEPVSKYADKIKARFKNNPKVQVYPMGLAGKTGQITLRLADNATSEFKTTGKAVQVKMKSVREFLSEKRIDRIDLMKINIEGGEYGLLEAMISSHLITKVENIQVQFHTHVENWGSRVEQIRNDLSKTHELTYQYLNVWENWRKK